MDLRAHYDVNKNKSLMSSNWHNHPKLLWLRISCPKFLILMFITLKGHHLALLNKWKGTVLFENVWMLEMEKHLSTITLARITQFDIDLTGHWPEVSDRIPISGRYKWGVLQKWSSLWGCQKPLNSAVCQTQPQRTEATTLHHSINYKNQPRINSSGVKRGPMNKDDKCLWWPLPPVN